ncbi:MAG TPA: SDR family NAD(P)-dependent oxidoreductase [Anaerolineales bacterium]|nr:SDR family NAD(P)-dependent oxidoreductase [Anaerolineales bacterium]
MNQHSTLTPTPAAIVIGASSGIGEAVARRLAREGYAVALVSRRAELLNRIAEQIKAGGGRAHVYPHDATNYAEAPTLFQTILRDLGRLDVVVYASGVMPAVDLSEFNFEKDKAMIDVNVLGAMAWLDQAAMALERLKRGSIVGISSVAGDRGRIGNPVYNASKAAFSTYLEALRNRLTRKGVHVLTVKPGFVDTEMLKGAKRTFWVISPDQAAADIYRAVKSRQQVIYTPARWGLMMLIIRHIPSFIFRRMSF